MKNFFLIVFAGLMLALLAGCVVERGRNPDTTLPANEPAGWEGTSLGVPI